MSGATWLVTIVALVARLSLWLLRPGLTYDGTYYLRQAERLTHLDFELIGFPPGYPLVVALLSFVTGDVELAGRYVSLLSGTATVALFHVWAWRKLPPALALIGALYLALHPEVARTSVEVLSEPLYIFVLLSAVVAFEARRDLLAGCLCGYAYLVRPEALAVLAGCLGIRAWEAWRSSRATERRRFSWGLLAASLLPVVLFSALWSAAIGHWVITPKQGQIDLDASIAARLWKTLVCLHAVFPVFLAPMAVYQGWRWRSILLAAVVYVGTLPFFAIHIQPRLLQPALPFLLVLALAWLAGFPRRRAFLAVAAGFAVWGAVPTARALFRDGIVTPYDRELGAALRPKLRFDDRVASRFPIVPYYAGAGFVRIPLSSYIATMDSLTQAGATHLLLLEHEALGMVPQLRPLFDDAGFATAEGRLELVETLAPSQGPRAILYRFVPSALTAASTTRLDSTATSAAWVGESVVFTTLDGGLRRAGAPFAAAVEAAMAQVQGARDVCFDSQSRHLAFVQATSTSAHIAELDLQSGLLRVHDSTGGDAPVSPCFAGEAILYVRGTGSGGLRTLAPATGRVRPVYFSGLEPGEAAPLFVTARGRDVAITYVRPRRERNDQRVLATARWPEAAAADSAVVLDGRWATQLALADDAIAWVPNADRLLASVAIRELDAEGQDVGGFSSLAVVAANGHMRVLAFDLTAPRRPTQAADRLAFIMDGSELRTTPLRSETLRVPEVRVFDAPRSSLLPARP